jgi:hypothetical protein
VSDRLHLALLHGAALLVRAQDRRDWLAEWRAELWYVWPRRRTGFCLGAFRDAFWLRRHNPPPVRLQSPWQCLGVLTALAGISLLFAFRLPLPREMLFPRPLPADLVTISGISVNDYRQLPARSAAFYGPAELRAGNLTVALASRNLFDLLNVPISPAAYPLVITLGAWRDLFGSDPHIVGRTLTVAGRPAQVAAILSDREWELPGPVDSWLLVDDRSFDTGTRGYVLARMNSSRRDVSVQHPDGSVNRFVCVPFAAPKLLVALLLMMGVSAMVLPAVTSLSLGEYPANHFRRWVFLAAKFALVLPIVLFGTLDVFSLIAIHLQPHALFVGSVIGFRWVLIDQRRRCPVCLRVLTNPTPIGEPSRTLLEWYGTELVCTRGHGLLHVPEIRNSYSEQRWLRLDSSWSSLF